MKAKSLVLYVVVVVVLQLLVGSSVSSGKAKVQVRVRVDAGIGKYPPQDSLSKSNLSLQGPLQSAEIYYFNVTVFSDSADVVAQNGGKWCIKGDADIGSSEYHGTLSGNDLVVETPQKNGKIRKLNFVVYDHKWRKLSDL